MSVASIVFIAFALATASLYQAMPGARSRHAVFLIANLIFVVSLLPDPLSGVPFFAFVLLGYGVHRSAPRLGPRWVAAVAVVGLVLIFAYLKRYSFLSAVPPLGFDYSVVGLSYILFRMLQIIVDARDMPDPKPLDFVPYLNFCCSFLTLISGPIQHSENFIAQVERPLPLDEVNCLTAVQRVVRGLVLVVLVSAALQGAFDMAKLRLFMPGSGTATAGAIYAAAATIYFVYLYANFAGYTDIVIGLGHLFGMRLPENFNAPLSAGSLIDFWSRWHMSLSEWFKTYVYTPFILAFARRYSTPAVQPYLGVLAFFFTFFLIGVWHGSTVTYVFYGLYLGLGISLNKLTQVALTKRIGAKAYRDLKRRRWYVLGSRMLTLGSISTALTCFWVDDHSFDLVVDRLGIVGWLVGGLLALVLALGLALLWDVFEKSTHALAPVEQRLAAGGALGFAVLSAQILALMMLATLFNAPPDFVYRAY